METVNFTHLCKIGTNFKICGANFYINIETNENLW